MDREIWKRIVRGMERSGFQKVLEIAPGLKVKADGILDKYPDTAYERKWYRNHLGYSVLFVKKKPESEPEVDPIREAVIARLDRQINKGKSEYGMRLYENDLPLGARMEHLADELIDGLQYIEHWRNLASELRGQLVDILADMAWLLSNVRAGKNPSYKEWREISARIRTVVERMKVDASQP